MSSLTLSTICCASCALQAMGFSTKTCFFPSRASITCSLRTMQIVKCVRHPTRHHISLASTQHTQVHIHWISFVITSYQYDPSPDPSRHPGISASFSFGCRCFCWGYVLVDGVECADIDHVHFLQAHQLRIRPHTDDAHTQCEERTTQGAKNRSRDKPQVVLTSHLGETPRDSSWVVSLLPISQETH